MQALAFKEAKRKAEEDRNKLTQNLTETLSQHGIAMKEATVWNHYGGRRNRGEAYKVRRASILISGDTKDYGEKVLVRGDVVSEKGNIERVGIVGEFTPEKFKQLADFVRDLDLKKDYTS